MTTSEQKVADALRLVGLRLEQALENGRRSARLTANDLLETLLAVADELDPPGPKQPGCEFCRCDANRTDDGFVCPYCQQSW